jgi:predicted transcriptional regulator
MSSKEETRQRTELLKRLRTEHPEAVDQAQALLKAQKALRQRISQALGDEPHTVPELAEATGLPADQVLWHVTAMRKYGLVVEAGKSDEYYLYRRAEGSKP